MRKRHELSDPNSCMNKAGLDEWTFVLLGRDVAATAAVQAWVGARLRLGKNTLDDPQIKEAEEWIRIVTWEQTHSAEMIPCPASESKCDVIGGFPVVCELCLGCHKPLVVENAWMTDGCPCNTPLGVNLLNETRWRLLMQLQQQQSRECEILMAALLSIATRPDEYDVDDTDRARAMQKFATVALAKINKGKAA